MLSNGENLTGTVEYKIEMTMLDGKAVNAITDTKSTRSSNVSKAKPSEMNDLTIVRSKCVDINSLKLGLSSLHCWIRCFEYILNLGYIMENKTFSGRTKGLSCRQKSRNQKKIQGKK